LHNSSPNLHNFAYAKHIITLEMGLSKPQSADPENMGIDTRGVFKGGALAPGPPPLKLKKLRKEKK